MLTGLWRFVPLTCLALAAAACESVDIAGPTPASMPATAAPFVNRGGLAQPDVFAIHPSFLVPRAIAQPFCPSLPPFAADFTLLVRGDRLAATTLAEVRMTFVDRAGLRAPAIVLPGPSLGRRFGSLAIPAGSARRFPLSAPFGCTTGRFGTLHVLVSTAKRGGHLSSALVTVPVN